jgi:hypothetical protein
MTTLTNPTPSLAHGPEAAARLAESDAVNGSCTTGLLEWVLGPLAVAEDRLGEQPKVRGAGVNPPPHEPVAVH